MTSGEQVAQRGAGPARSVPWVTGLAAALCAVLLLKWLAVVAIAMVVLVGAVRWARTGRLDGPADAPASAPVDAHTDAYIDARAEDPTPVVETAEPVAVEPPAPRRSPDDCSWCGRAGGHRDPDGRLLRPRHVHVMR